MTEPLSPRAVNRQSKQPPPVKIDTANKDKNHAPPPPKVVAEPGGELGVKYETGKLLGRGGFAVCYEGTIMGHKYGKNLPKFALKIVKAKMGMKKMEEKFRTELQIHSKMRHPNIVEFHRAFTFEDNTYIVLELCPNGSLKDMVQNRRCLSLPEVRRYGVQLCGAIKYLHARGVIHRDLKMGNIFLDEGMNMKIGDFGLAAILLKESDVGAFSRRTTLCGTPNYIAPEILGKDRKGHDFKVDIWAVGVIMFALLTGCPPFQSKSQEDIYRKVKSLEYAWPVKSHNDFPEEAKDLVTSILKTDALERPSPDEIIAHPFFVMHGADAIPASLEPECFSKKPGWLDSIKSPRGDVMTKFAKRISLQQLAEECGVGCFGDDSVQVVGSNIGETIYQALLQEETARKGPPVPLPDTMVYSSSTSSIFNEPTPKERPTIRAKAQRSASSRAASSRAITSRKVSSRSAPSRNISNRIEPPGPTPSLLQPILIDPSEPSTLVPHTSPTSVMHLLDTLSSTLTSAFSPTPPPTHHPKHPPNIHDRPHILKWVDYTNKYGIGYILANGTIGVIFNGTDTRPSTCVCVPHADTHVRNRYSTSYPERQQLVPKNGPPISFLENRGDAGIHRVLGNPADYRIKHTKGGVAEKFGPAPGLGSFDNEKRRLLSLWDKFARYMYQTLGEKTPRPGSNTSKASNHSQPDEPPFVKFYQRLGNVGIWGFSTGTFQFNFPDHTKLVLTPDGWADFYHNSRSAALLLRKGRTLTPEALEERGLLSVPVRALVQGGGGEEHGELVEVNEGREKLRFVRGVVEAWRENGGVGRMGKVEGVRWEGLREEGGRERCVWATVGVSGGDGKRVEGGRKG